MNLVLFVYLISIDGTRNSGKEIEELDNAHNNCLMYKLASSSKDIDDLSIGFHGYITTRERELPYIKTTEEFILLKFF